MLNPGNPMTLMRELRQPCWRAIGLLALTAATALLVACGGGSAQVEAFRPNRVLAMGDENSVIVDNGSADGFRYTINDRTSTAAGKCQALPNFAQSLISVYGYVFKECNPSGATPAAFVLAQAGARVDDPATGLARQIARVAGGLGPTDLVTVMLGANDVIALYEDVREGRRTEAQAVAEVQRLGILAADGVNTILATGARALVITIPDMGSSPYAIAQATTTGYAMTLMARLSYDFNANLRTQVDATRFDGRNYGLVLADDIVSAIVRAPTAFLLAPANVTEAACSTANVVDCLTTTLQTGATATSHLWASDRHLGPEAHRQIGLQAQTRAVNNPF
jgi:outer membrane lipase/esterase